MYDLSDDDKELENFVAEGRGPVNDFDIRVWSSLIFF